MWAAKHPTLLRQHNRFVFGDDVLLQHAMRPLALHHEKIGGHLAAGDVYRRSPRVAVIHSASSLRSFGSLV